MSIVAVIPARLASSRIPGKALVPIAGKPLIRHVAERLCATGVAERYLLSTDDSRIAAAVRGLPLDVVIDAEPYRCGSDRVYGAVSRLGLAEDTRVLNVQGDEALVEGAMVQGALRALSQASLGTVAAPAVAESFAADQVEVLLDTSETLARDFRRCAGQSSGEKLLHIGVYAYRLATLRQFASLPSSLREQREGLEQLRALEAGWPIGVELLPGASVASVNVPRDVQRLEGMLARRQ
jgi:3-deoxy-manno-octulosonate cytidylyltransferase (CMP-KDO synthetase)